MGSRLTALRMLTWPGLAALCWAPCCRAQEGDADELPKVRTVIWGIPDECLPGEELRLRVTVQNPAPDEQLVRLPEYVDTSWARRDARGQWRRIQTPFAHRVLDRASQFGLYSPQERRTVIRTLLVPYAKTDEQAGDEVAVLVEASDAQLEDGGDGKGVVVGTTLEYAVPTRIAPYSVEKVWTSDRITQHKMVMEIGEVTTKGDRYLVLGLRWIDSNDRWPLLHRLGQFRPGERCMAVSGPLFAQDATVLAVGWTCSHAEGGSACWQLFGNAGNLRLEYSGHGELQSEGIPGRPELREDQGNIRLVVDRPGGGPPLRMVLRPDVSVSTDPADGERAGDAAVGP